MRKGAMMVEKFVVFNKTTGEYFKRGYGVTTDQKYARLYTRRCDAQNSLNRHRWRGLNFDVYPVSMDLTVGAVSDTPVFDSLVAVSAMEPLPFKVAVDHFRDAYGFDLAGTLPGVYTVSYDMIDLFHRNFKHLSGPNGVRFLLSEEIFDKESPLPQMLGAELLRQFGVTVMGKRVALFEVDWFDAEGKHNVNGY